MKKNKIQIKIKSKRKSYRLGMEKKVEAPQVSMQKRCKLRWCLFNLYLKVLLIRRDYPPIKYLHVVIIISSISIILVKVIKIFVKVVLMRWCDEGSVWCEDCLMYLSCDIESSEDDNRVCSVFLLLGDDEIL